MTDAMFAKAVDAYRAISLARVPLACAVFAFVVLSLPDQTRELYRALTQDAAEKGTEIAISFVAVGLMGCWVGLIALALTTGGRADARERPTGAFAKAIPFTAAALGPLGLAIGVYVAGYEVNYFAGWAETAGKIIEIKQLADSTGSARATLFGAFLSALFVAAVCGIAVTRSQADFVARMFRRRRFLIVLGSLVAVVLGVAAIKSNWLVPVGAIPLFALFVSFLCYFGSALGRVSDRIHAPLVSALVIAAFALSAVGLNDNHVVRLSDTTSAVRLGSSDAFERWYEAREDRDAFKGKPYPVFIVSAAGGGLYAAYFAATVLARLQDRCPSFAQHVFAVSGVSGGSLGAAIFAALAQRQADNARLKPCSFGPLEKGPFERQAQHLLGRDYLTPLLAMGLFRILRSVFFPCPSRPSIARELSTPWSKRAGTRLLPEAGIRLESRF